MTRRRVRLVDIDRLIDERFMPKKCFTRHKRGRCQCGHCDLVHGVDVDDPTLRGLHMGRCHGKGPRNRGPCPCLKFAPYDYAKEQARQRDKLRAFAFDVLRLDIKEE